MSKLMLYDQWSFERTATAKQRKKTWMARVCRADLIQMMDQQLDKVPFRTELSTSFTN